MLVVILDGLRIQRSAQRSAQRVCSKQELRTWRHLDIPQPKATLAIGPGAGFSFALLFIFPMGDASVVAEGRGVALKVSVMLCETVALSACRGTNGS